MTPRQRKTKPIISFQRTRSGFITPGRTCPTNCFALSTILPDQQDSAFMVTTGGDIVRSMIRVFYVFLLAAPAQAADKPAWSVPTFESLGLYYNRAIADKPCKVHYRVSGKG